MSGPNPSELGKSQNQENPITRSQVKNKYWTCKICGTNQTGPLKPKRTVTVKEKVTKDIIKENKKKIFLTKTKQISVFNQIIFL